MRILAIGDVDPLTGAQRVLSRAEHDLYRVPAALAAARMVRQIPFDLMIVVHPLADADFAGFHSGIRAHDSPCRGSQLLVLSPRSRLPELDEFEGDSRLEAIAIDQPQHRLAEAASRYLGPIRAAERYDLKLPVRWGAVEGDDRTENISATGALIAFEAGSRPQVGERSRLYLPASVETIRIPAMVVRHSEEGRDRARGFAVTWISAAAAELDRLERLLATRGSEPS